MCENESIDASGAPLAEDLRTLVRERLVAGNSDEDIRRLLAERYGDYVLFRPRLAWRNALLWAGPFVILAAAGLLLVFRARKAKVSPVAPLSSGEESAVNSLLEAGSAKATRQDAAVSQKRHDAR